MIQNRTQKNMKEAANFIWSVYLLIIIQVDILLLRPSLHFTTLVDGNVCGPHHGNCFTSPFCSLEISDGSYISGKFVYPFNTSSPESFKVDNTLLQMLTVGHWTLLFSCPVSVAYVTHCSNLTDIKRELIQKAILGHEGGGRGEKELADVGWISH